jgi:hypothetical protein
VSGTRSARAVREAVGAAGERGRAAAGAGGPAAARAGGQSQPDLPSGPGQAAAAPRPRQARSARTRDRAAPRAAAPVADRRRQSLHVPDRGQHRAGTGRAHLLDGVRAAGPGALGADHHRRAAVAAQRRVVRHRVGGAARLRTRQRDRAHGLRQAVARDHAAGGRQRRRGVARSAARQLLAAAQDALARLPRSRPQSRRGRPAQRRARDRQRRRLLPVVVQADVPRRCVPARHARLAARVPPRGARRRPAGPAVGRRGAGGAVDVRTDRARGGRGPVAAAGASAAAGPGSGAARRGGGARRHRLPRSPLHQAAAAAGQAGDDGGAQAAAAAGRTARWQRARVPG